MRNSGVSVTRSTERDLTRGVTLRFNRRPAVQMCASGWLAAVTKDDCHRSTPFARLCHGNSSIVPCMHIGSPARCDMPHDTLVCVLDHSPGLRGCHQRVPSVSGSLSDAEIRLVQLLLGGRADVNCCVCGRHRARAAVRRPRSACRKPVRTYRRAGCSDLLRINIHAQSLHHAC